jgi:uncharacterized spore protein YtfJ
MDTTDKQQFLKSLSEQVSESATVQKVYGEPIIHEQKTIIPVAKVRAGFGGGFGEARSDSSQEGSRNEGSGMGGGLMVDPVGVYEITAESTRFVPLRKGRYVAVGVVLGILFSKLFLR